MATQRIFLVLESLGDGSARAKPYLDKGEADAYAETLPERFCDDVGSVEITIEDGKVVGVKG